jgi:hypothetical protein
VLISFRGSRTVLRGVASYLRFSREELGGRFLGLMPNFVPKGLRGAIVW